MGVRKWMERPMVVRGHHLGVEDLTEGQQGVPVCDHCLSHSMAAD